MQENKEAECVLPIGKDPAGRAGALYHEDDRSGLFTERPVRVGVLYRRRAGCLAAWRGAGGHPEAGRAGGWG